MYCTVYHTCKKCRKQFIVTPGRQNVCPSCVGKVTSNSIRSALQRGKEVEYGIPKEIFPYETIKKKRKIALEALIEKAIAPIRGDLYYELIEQGIDPLLDDLSDFEPSDDLKEIISFHLSNVAFAKDTYGFKRTIWLLIRSMVIKEYVENYFKKKQL